MCVATVQWSLAQRSRTATNGSNQPGVTIPALAGHTGLSGNSSSAAQPGTNPASRTITGANTNVGARIGINAGAQTGISNQAVGITGSAAGGLAGSSGARIGINAGAQTGISNQPVGITGSAPGRLAGSSGKSMVPIQTGANAGAGINTTANMNAGAHTAAATTPASLSNIQSQFILVPTPSPLLNNNALSPNFSTPGQSPSPQPSASPTPMSTAPPL
jgi:hypothetical protein